MLEVFAPIAPELKDILNQMERDYQLKAGPAFRLAPIELTPLEEVLHPALVLLSAGLYGLSSAKVQALAKVVQFIRLATAVHHLVPEAGAGVGEDLQTADRVLVGDYLYGKFYVYLSRHDLLEFLDPLARSIAAIHEGAMIRKDHWEEGRRDHKTAASIAAGEYGALLAQSCLLAGRLAGVSPQEEDRLQAFGLHLGMALGMDRLGAPQEWKEEQGQLAKSCLRDMPDTIQRKIMGQIVDLIVPPRKEVHKLVG